MPRRAALNISMPPELAAYVAELVASGRYRTASEAVRTGLRLLREKEAASSRTAPDGEASPKAEIRRPRCLLDGVEQRADRAEAGASIVASSDRALLAVTQEETHQARQDTRQASETADRAAVQHRTEMTAHHAEAARRDGLYTALHSSEGRLRLILESATDFAIFAMDLDGRVTEWNFSARNVLGWSEADMLGQSVQVIWTPKDRDAGIPEQEMRLARDTGRAPDERWHMRQDGSRFWASGEMLAMQDESGRLVGYLKMLRDRTEQHLAGEALRLGEKRFKTILDTIQAAFAIVEVKFDADDQPVDYRFVEANPAFERQAGVNLRGKWVTEFAPNLERFWFETYGRVAKTGEPAEFENFAEAFGRWFDVLAVRVGDPAERQIAIFFTDSTARREAEDRLRVSEALARENVERVQLALQAGAIIGTWHWDIPIDRFTVDEAFADAFGLDPALGRIGIPLAQIVATVHPDDQPGLAAAIGEAIERGGNYAHQYRVRRANGKYHWIEANGRVDLAPDGTPQSFPGVLLDVEERRAVEAERDRVTDELRALTETLEQRIDERTAELMHAEAALRQSQKMEAVGQLTGGLAHDFNNLLTGVTGSLELLQTRIAQGRIKDVDRYVTAAQGAANRAAALTHRLLAFSRRQTLDPKPTDVNRLVSGMEELVRRTVGPETAVDTVGPPDLWASLVDPGQLENALLNLCINARDAMPDGGRITVETANRRLDKWTARDRDMEPGEYVSLCVSDTGTGMPPDVASKALDPFFTTKPIGQGTGLGLSMIYGFVKQSGGQIRIHTEVAKGTTVCVYLPRHRGDADPNQPGRGRGHPRRSRCQFRHRGFGRLGMAQHGFARLCRSQRPIGQPMEQQGGEKRGAEPARRAFGPALFDAIPKAVLGRIAYELARHGDGGDVGDQAAKRRVLEMWDKLEPEGLPLPSPDERAALTGCDISKSAG